GVELTAAGYSSNRAVIIQNETFAGPAARAGVLAAHIDKVKARYGRPWKEAYSAEKSNLVWYIRLNDHEKSDTYNPPGFWDRLNGEDCPGIDSFMVNTFLWVGERGGGLRGVGIPKYCDLAIFFDAADEQVIDKGKAATGIKIRTTVFDYGLFQ